MHAVTLTGGRCTVYSDLASKEALLGAIVADCFLTLGGVTIVEPVRSLQPAQKTYRVFRQRRRRLARWLEDARLMVDDPTGRVKQFLGLTKAFARWPQILGGQRVPHGAERTPDTRFHLGDFHEARCCRQRVAREVAYRAAIRYVSKH